MVFEKAPAFGGSEVGYVGFELDNVNILLEPAEPGEFEAGGYLGFSIAVKEIAVFYEVNRTAGVKFKHKPTEQEWGGIMTHIEDPAGNVFSVIQENE
jgi:predicted enzyme related to lactoylglutathione lyase